MAEDRRPRPRCAPRDPLPNVGVLLASGKLKISPEAWQSSEEEILAIVERFYRGDWGKERPKKVDYPGRYLLAAYRIGSMLVHVLADHVHEFTEVVLAND
ncbi:MAG: hypothetical protein U0835_00530 [Isosphaeraceae bacterium]